MSPKSFVKINVTFKAASKMTGSRHLITSKRFTDKRFKM